MRSKAFHLLEKTATSEISLQTVNILIEIFPSLFPTLPRSPVYSAVWCKLPTTERVQILLSVAKDARANAQLESLYLPAFFRRVLRCQVASDDIEIVSPGKGPSQKFAEARLNEQN